MMGNREKYQRGAQFEQRNSAYRLMFFCYWLKSVRVGSISGKGRSHGDYQFKN